MENWKAGDTAICINNGKLPTTGSGEIPLLRKGAQYIVNTVRVCECGCVTLDVGLSLREDVNKGVACDCGALSSPKSRIHWCASTRFVKPKTDKSEAEESFSHQIEKAIEAGDQDLVDELLDRIKK